MGRRLRGGWWIAICTLALELVLGVVDGRAQEVAFDQQSPLSPWNALNAGAYALSQGFKPIYRRMNFADIYLTGGGGAAVNGDFSVRLKRNGVVEEESDRRVITAANGLAGDFYRFAFADEAFLFPGDQYELELVNHTGSNYFGWGQTYDNTYAGGDPAGTGGAGTGGDLIFRTGMQSIYSPPQAQAHGPGYMLFESALKPPTPLPVGGGTVVSSSFFSGLNFEITAPTRLTKVGAYFGSTTGSLFGALVKTTGFAGIPVPPNLSGSDVRATTVITPPAGGGDAWGNVDVTLEPGWYGLIFGSGKFGASGSSGLSAQPDSNGGAWSPFSIRQSDGQRFFQATDVRIFAEALPAGGTMQQRPVFDARGQKFGSQWIVIDGESSIGPERIDSLSIDVRGLMEFDLSQVPAGATITGARLNIEPNQITSGGGGSGPRLFVHGYQGDGAASAADPASPLNQIGSTSVITTFAPITIDLSATYIQSLVDADATHLGLMIRPDSNGHRAHYITWEGGEPSAVPLLTIDYSLPPQPGDFDANGQINGGDLQAWTNRFGADLDGEDFLEWQRGFTGGGATTPVPEPASVLVAVLGTAMAFGLRRRCEETRHRHDAG